jgi:uncharacterized protein (TIGR03435 family)
MEQITQPFPIAVPLAPSARGTADWVLIAILAVWACGFTAVALMRFRGWLRVRTAVRSSTWSRSPTCPVEIRFSPGLLEPGVVGVFRPILLLPAGIAERLTQPQLEAVLAHELCQVRRRDNLFASIHMIVEAVFWFQPLVWWIGARLVEERERACDEEVLLLGNAPHVYAEGILNVCKLYVKSPLECVSGVTGANLKRRIEVIMSNRIVLRLNFGKRLLLVALGILAASAPLIVGLVKAQSDAPLAFEVASVRQHVIKEGFIRRAPSSNLQCPPFHCGISGTRFTEEVASLKDLIMDAYNLKEFQISGLPTWGDSARDVFDIAAKVEGNRTPTPDHVRRMLQTLLADRFQLRFHHETRVFPVYALVVGKKGPKITPVSPEEAKSSPDRISMFSMEQIAGMLGPLADRPVIDKTGLKGLYTFEDTFEALDIRQLLQDRRAGPDAAQSGASLFTQVQEQWGLKLEPQKGPADILVIDRVARPTEN